MFQELRTFSLIKFVEYFMILQNVNLTKNVSVPLLSYTADLKYSRTDLKCNSYVSWQPDPNVFFIEDLRGTW